MYKNLSFSNYLFTFERGGIISIFHSLKMQPVYIENRLFPLLKEVIDSPYEYDDNKIISKYNNDSKSIIAIINGLIDNRVLNKELNKDEQVLYHFQNSLKTGNIKIAYFILAESCNLSCSYCFENAQSCVSDSKTIMSENIAIKSINFYEKMLSLYDSKDEEKDIIFYGGEPLINYNVLIKVLEEIKRRKKDIKLWKNVKMSIVTNGVLLSESILKTLSEFDVAVAISIDGPKYINDINRFDKNGNSVFNEILKGIELCKKNNVNFSLSMTLSEDVVKNYEDVIKFIEKTKPNSLGFNILMTDTNFRPYDEYNNDATDFLIKAFKKFRKENIYEDRIMRKVKSFVKSEVYPFDCGATGASQIILSPSGKVGICHGYLQEKKFFPTNVDDLDFIPMKNKVFKEWSRRTPLNMKECQSCIALGICGGGCPLNAERNLGSIWNLDERFCLHAKKTLEWMIWDLFDNSKK